MRVRISADFCGIVLPFRERKVKIEHTEVSESLMYDTEQINI